MILCKEFCLFVYFRWSDCKIMNKCWFLKKIVLLYVLVSMSGLSGVWKFVLNMRMYYKKGCFKLLFLFEIIEV